MSRKIHSEEFRKIFYEKFPNYNLLSDYITSKDKVSYVCDKGHQCEAYPGNIMNGHGCNFCRKIERRTKNEDFLKKLNDVHHGNILPNEDYVNSRTKIEFCCIHKHTWKALPSQILFGKGCPFCSINNFTKNVAHKPKPIKERNLIINKRPDLVKYLYDKKDAYSKTIGMHKNIKIKCPYCEDIFEQAIPELIRRGVNCPSCGDSYSFPNRFMYNLLKELKIDFNREYHPDWGSNVFYDFFFLIRDNKYIVEMDGGFHFNKNYYNNGVPLDKVVEKDKLKDELATANNVKIIRIDCNYGNSKKFEYIKNNIINSELSDILNFDNIVWEDINEKAMAGLCPYICDEYMNGDKNINTLSIKLKFDKSTIKKHLIRGAQLGLCNYNPDFL